MELGVIQKFYQSLFILFRSVPFRHTTARVPFRSVPVRNDGDSRDADANVRVDARAMRRTSGTDSTGSTRCGSPSRVAVAFWRA